MNPSTRSRFEQIFQAQSAVAISFSQSSKNLCATCAFAFRINTMFLLSSEEMDLSFDPLSAVLPSSIQLSTTFWLHQSQLPLKHKPSPFDPLKEQSLGISQAVTSKVDNAGCRTGVKKSAALTICLCLGSTRSLVEEDVGTSRGSSGWLTPPKWQLMVYYGLLAIESNCASRTPTSWVK